MGFAIAAAALAGLFALVAAYFRKIEAPQATSRLAVGAFATAALAALSLGLIFALDKGMLTVALALTALGGAFVSARLDIRTLRSAVAALGLLVLARLVWDPRVVGADLGRSLISTGCSSATASRRSLFSWPRGCCVASAAKISRRGSRSRSRSSLRRSSCFSRYTMR